MSFVPVNFINQRIVPERREQPEHCDVTLKMVHDAIYELSVSNEEFTYKKVQDKLDYWKAPKSLNCKEFRIRRLE